MTVAIATSGLAQGVEQRHEFVQANGIKLHYVTAGSGQTVLFLHGFPEFWYAWKGQFAEFGKDHRAVALDMRGYNLSDKPAKVEDYAIQNVVADVKAVLEKLSPGKKAILVGHDWGGVIAWMVAIQHPDLLEKLVIINAPHPAIFARELKENPDQQKASGYMNIFKSAQAEALLSAGNYGALQNGVFGSAARKDTFSDADRKAYLEAWAIPGALTGGLNYYRASGVGPPVAGQESKLAIPDPFPVLHVPTLVIWGEKDTALLVAGNLRGMEKYVEKITFKRIPSGTHWVVHDEPETVNRMIREFIAR